MKRKKGKQNACSSYLFNPQNFLLFTIIYVLPSNIVSTLSCLHLFYNNNLCSDTIDLNIPNRVLKKECQKYL